MYRLSFQGCDQVRHRFCRIGCAHACDWIPACSSGVALDTSWHVDISSLSDVMEVLLIVGRGRQLIETRIDKAQRMSCHLIGNGLKSSPDWRTAIIASELPLALPVNSWSCGGVLVY